jgi:hypothetical protein
MADDVICARLLGRAMETGPGRGVVVTGVEKEEQ